MPRSLRIREDVILDGEINIEIDGEQVKLSEIIKAIGRKLPDWDNLKDNAKSRNV